MIEQLDKDELLALLHKRCTTCGVVKYFGEFNKQNGCSGGVTSQCKACAAERNRRYREKNKERVAERNRRWNEENKERVVEHKRKWREENPEKVAESQRKWREENPEKYAESQRTRRARKANANGTHTAEQVKARFDYYGNKCIYCGSEENLEVEHRIPLTRGGSDWAANLAPACKSCNCSKGTKTETEFKKILEKQNE